ALGPMAMADVNGDGALDLFLGGRVLPGRYPEPTASALLLARDGAWTPDPASAERFARLGLVTAALFSDLDADGDPDLVVSCEWGPIRLFWNEGGVLREREVQVRWGDGRSGPGRLSDLTGLWQGMVSVDLDEDGRLDLVAANWGANTSRQEGRIPGVGWRLWFGDLDTNGTVELLESRWDAAAGQEVLAGSRSRLTAAWPELAARYPTRRSLASASVSNVLASVASPVGSVSVSVLESLVLLNRGDHLEVRPLPAHAQWAPGTSLAVADFDGDGHEDLFLGHNVSEEALGSDRMDAGLGLWLRGDGRGNLEAVSASRSGIRVWGEARGAAVADFDRDGRPDLVVAQNEQSTRLYRNEGGTPGLRIRIRQPGGNPDGIGAQMRWLSGGIPVGPVREVRAGSGYWSQDSPVTIFHRPVHGDALQIRRSGSPASMFSISPGAEEIEVGPSDIRTVR
ncbi:MAG: VCBS repeat-containing protein, partial [Verrucomicrobia bacterium]|nr:VCBS repeat-containing protein [Verrucomicrobiota bacterium]